MRRHPAARLFVAIDPPQEVCEQLATWARTALRATAGGQAAMVASHGRAAMGAPVRVLEPELLHLTLCFLGDRPVGEIEAIGAQVLAAAEPVGELSVGAPLWLPPRRPRVLAVELHDDRGALSELHRRLVASIREVCELEDTRGGRGRRHRRFRPHVTVARMRSGAAPRERTLAPTPSLSFVPRALVLYRSWLSEDGASYEALTSCAI